MISPAVCQALLAEGSLRPDELDARTRTAVALSSGLLVVPLLVYVFFGRAVLGIFGSTYAANGTTLLRILAISSIPDLVTNVAVARYRVLGRLGRGGRGQLGHRRRRDRWHRVGALGARHRRRRVGVDRGPGGRLRGPPRHRRGRPASGREVARAPRRGGVRILHLTDLFAPTIGGTETHVLSLVRERVRRGHEMSVVTLVQRGGTPSDDVEDVGFRVHRIDAGFTKLRSAWASVEHTPYHPPCPDPVVAATLRRIIERERPDAVHAHNWMIYSYLAFKTRSHPPVLWMQHDYSIACAKKTRRFVSADEHCPGASPLRCVRCSAAQYGPVKAAAVTLGLFASNATLLRRVDRVVANSEPVARRAREATGLRGDVAVVSSFIEDDLAEQAARVPRPPYLPKEDGYLLYVGGLGPHKGTHDLLAAYDRLVDPPPLVVLGVPMDGQPERWPEGTILRTHVPHDEVMAAFTHCAMGIVPSRWDEPFGFVALEANAVGRPVVATDVGGLAGVVLDGVTGVLVAPRDPAALAAGIQGLLDDPSRAATMGAAGRAHAATYSVRLAAPRFDAMLEALVERHRAAG